MVDFICSLAGDAQTHSRGDLYDLYAFKICAQRLTDSSQHSLPHLIQSINDDACEWHSDENIVVAIAIYIPPDTDER